MNFFLTTFNFSVLHIIQSRNQWHKYKVRIPQQALFQVNTFATEKKMESFITFQFW